MAIESDYIPQTYTADETTLAKTGNQFAVKALGIDTAQLKASGVTIAKLATDVLNGNVGKRKLVQTQTLAATATSIDFSGLNGNADGNYTLVANLIAAQTADVSLYVNNATTATDYYSQTLKASSTTLSGARANNAIIEAVSAGNNVNFITAKCFLNNGYFIALCDQVVATSGIYQNHTSIAKTAQIANITQLTLTASTGNTFGIGSVFSLYVDAIA
jgi:hypothetical protein